MQAMAARAHNTQRMRLIHHQPGIMAPGNFNEARQIRDVAIHGIMAFNHQKRPPRAAPRFLQRRFRRAPIIMREGKPLGAGKPGAFRAGIVNGRVMQNEITRPQQMANHGNIGGMA